MARSATGRPTDLELAILKVLWDRGPSTVRDVMETLAPERKAGYTTVLKILQIMTTKELVVPDDRRKTYIYRARKGKRATLKKLAGDLLDRAFDGSMSQFVLHALEHKKASAKEIAEIIELLEDFEKRSR